MSLPKLTKTNYSGVSYYKDSSKGKVFVAIFEVNKKRYRKIVGYENDEFKTNAKIAYLKKEELKNDILNNNYASKNITFKQLWELYFTHLEDSKSVAKRTYETKKSYYNAHFKNVFDNLAINNIQVCKISDNVSTCFTFMFPFFQTSFKSVKL